jgi:hypothetical protein
MTVIEESELIRLYNLWLAEVDLNKRNILTKDTFAAILKKSLTEKGRWKDKARGKPIFKNKEERLDFMLVSFIIANMGKTKDEAKDYLTLLRCYKDSSLVPFTKDKVNWVALMLMSKEFKDQMQ